MPVCQNCGHTWTFGKSLKRSFTLTTSMRCPNCEVHQYQTAASRKRTALLTSLCISSTMGSSIFLDIGWYSFGLLVLALLITIVTYPRLLKVSNTEEHLFLS